MKKIPDVIFVVDGSYEKQAVKEAQSLSIPCYAISNTNGNPYSVMEAIPANTNSVKSLDYLAIALKPAFTGTPKKVVEKSEEPSEKSESSEKKAKEEKSEEK